ncbi:hypothetical protein [Dermatobacter hominis]|uniref:hypothetical protein n=1 Tax=Dermatobacter hominis TaxID=2884263 RepID=UPI001D0F4E1B|nr:hypothetical protein [Dermatobacter hominis]UDY36793.1 hypothetical protein LH044_04470 [Dermatobacter hominis]
MSRPRRLVVRPRLLRPVLAVACALGALVVVATGCLPQERGPAREVEGADAAPSQPPTFPDTGPVPRELLIEGLEYDFTASEADLDLWVPPADQAACAATRIVDTLGPPRLSELGYRPATSGASLNDIDLTDAERDIVASNFAGCVDMRDAVASLFMGDSDMQSKEAVCLADGLAKQDLLDPFARAWAFGQTVNPAADDGTLANALMALAAVCLPDDAFSWTDRNLPGDDEVQGTGSGSGTTTTTVAGSQDGLQSRIPSTSTP